MADISETAQVSLRIDNRLRGLANATDRAEWEHVLFSRGHTSWLGMLLIEGKTALTDEGWGCSLNKSNGGKRRGGWREELG